MRRREINKAHREKLQLAQKAEQDEADLINEQRALVQKGNREEQRHVANKERTLQHMYEDWEEER